jgi:hypothetical protein
MKKKFEGNLVVFDLRETYHEFGEYSFKIVLNPEMFRDSHDSVVSMVDASGRQMDFETKRWGRKINCSFVIDESVADGVSAVYLDLVNNKGEIVKEFLSYWVIK